MLEGEENIQSDGKSGMGLTEGDGAKDVSDQIESQDQLEDAKKDYNEQTEPDKDLKVNNLIFIILGLKTSSYCVNFHSKILVLMLKNANNFNGRVGCLQFFFLSL